VLCKGLSSAPFCGLPRGEGPKIELQGDYLLPSSCSLPLPVWVTSLQIEGYISQATGTDYSYFFDQYLRHAAIPVFIVHAEPHGSDLQVRYKWAADVPGFRMPIKVTLTRDTLGFIYPTTDWQTMTLKRMAATDFRVDTTEFYVEVRME
jgi:hypothetical protein